MTRPSREQVPRRPTAELALRLGPLTVATVLTLVGLTWVQLLTVAAALGRVAPGASPVGWTVTAAGSASGSLVALTATAVTARALRRRGEPPTSASVLSLVPVGIAAAVQTGSGLLAEGPAVPAVLLQGAAVLLGGVAGVCVAAARDRADEPDLHLPGRQRQPPDRLLIDEEPL